MEWLKPILMLLQAGLAAYVSGQFIKKSSENAKSLALRSSIIAIGVLSFVIFLVASIIMVFVDLGHQFEAHDGIHFSGMMLSGAFLLTLGLLFLGICFGTAKYLAVQEENKKKVQQAEVNPHAALLSFGEELLKQLIANLNQGSNQSEPKTE